MIARRTLLAAPALLAAPREERLEDWKRIRETPLRAVLHHVQGIDTDGKRLWVSSVDAKRRRGLLSLFDLASGALVKQVEIQEGDKFHPGGICLDGGAIWTPCAEYRRASTASLQRRDAASLGLLSSFAVNDHIGCVAATPDGLAAGNWDSKEISWWSKEGTSLSRRLNPTGTSFQDMKSVDGLLVASGNTSRDEGAIEWFTLPDLRLERRLRAGKTDRGVRFTNEGMAWRGGLLYLLPEDDPSRLFVFQPVSGSSGISPERRSP